MPIPLRGHFSSKAFVLSFPLFATLRTESVSRTNCSANKWTTSPDSLTNRRLSTWLLATKELGVSPVAVTCLKVKILSRTCMVLPTDCTLSLVKPISDNRILPRRCCNHNPLTDMCCKETRVITRDCHSTRTRDRSLLPPSPLFLLSAEVSTGRSVIPTNALLSGMACKIFFSTFFRIRGLLECFENYHSF